MGLDRETVVHGFQLVLGREPENETTIEECMKYDDIVTLRNALLTSREFNSFMKANHLLELFYAYCNEPRLSKATDDLETFMSLTDELSEIIANELNTFNNSYETLHRKRFYDQVRLVTAFCEKKFSNLPEIRLLEVGAANVTRLYTKINSRAEVYTADLQKGLSADREARRFGAREHFPIDLEEQALSDAYPALREKKFHIIVFCEIIEHLRISPEEAISDLLSLLADDGILMLSTPNVFSHGRLRNMLAGIGPQELYSRKDARRHNEHHMHVREYSFAELERATIASGGIVSQFMLKDYLVKRKNVITEKFVSSRGQITMIIRRKHRP